MDLDLAHIMDTLLYIYVETFQHLLQCDLRIILGCHSHMYAPLAMDTTRISSLHVSLARASLQSWFFLLGEWGFVPESTWIGKFNLILKLFGHHKLYKATRLTLQK